MTKTFRNTAPFILLGLSIVLSICSYFGFYIDIFGFLGDLVGYSVFTNLFMYSVYINKRYCTATKIAVIGLIALNVFNILYKIFEISGAVYDIFIGIIVVFVLLIYKIEN